MACLVTLKKTFSANNFIVSIMDLGLLGNTYPIQSKQVIHGLSDKRDFDMDPSYRYLTESKTRQHGQASVKMLNLSSLRHLMQRFQNWKTLRCCI